MCSHHGSSAGWLLKDTQWYSGQGQPRPTGAPDEQHHGCLVQLNTLFWMASVAPFACPPQSYKAIDVHGRTCKSVFLQAGRKGERMKEREKREREKEILLSIRKRFEF